MTDDKFQVAPYQSPVASPGKIHEMIMSEELGEIVPRVWTSCPLTTPEERLQLYDVLAGETDSAPDYINTVLPIINVTIFPARILNRETGEIITAQAVLLHLAGGKVVRFVSIGILKSLGTLFQLGFLPPYDPPMKMTLKRVALDAGRSMYRLVRYVEPEATPKKK